MHSGNVIFLLFSHGIQFDIRLFLFAVFELRHYLLRGHVSASCCPGATANGTETTWSTDLLS